MKMQSFLPTAALQPFVKSYLVVASEDGMTNHILPDTSVVMAFRIRGQAAYRTGDATEQLPATVITGIRKTVRVVAYERNSANLMVIFREGGASAFFDCPMHELSDASVRLDQLLTWQQLDYVEEKLGAACDHQQRVHIAEQFLLSLLRQSQPDTLVQEAIRQIKLAGGNIMIKELLAGLPVSRDAFEKRFRKITGTTPRQFAGIIRLRHVIEHYSPSQTLTSIAHNAGYFDQAHFIKDFRLFTGKTPGAFFQSPVYW